MFHRGVERKSIRFLDVDRSGGTAPIEKLFQRFNVHRRFRFPRRSPVVVRENVVSVGFDVRVHLFGCYVTRPRDRDDARAVAPFDCRTDDVSEILSPLALRPSGAMRFIGRWTILVVLVLQIEEDVRSSQESNSCGFQGLLVTGSAQTLRASSILHDVYREAQIDDEMLCGGAVDERFQLRHLQRTQRAVAIHQRFGSELPVREDA